MLTVVHCEVLFLEYQEPNHLTRLVSPAALIAVAVAGICGFALPERDFANAIRLWRLGLAGTAAVGGLFGLAAGMVALVLHLATLESMGQPYLRVTGDRGHPGILRERLCRQKFRDAALNPQDRRNQK